MTQHRKILLLFCLAIIGAFIFLSTTQSSVLDSITKTQSNFKNGDIIFQTSQSEQCEAVRIATNSKFSHCGIIFIENGKTYVYEAVQPVKMTLLSDWIQHGEGNKYVVKRLQNADKVLNNDVIQKMKSYGETLNNKDYDIYFEWSNDKIYCSELVWKIYKEGANIELCNLQKLKEFNLEHPLVKTILNERYGNAVPLDEEVVAPSQIVDSDKLITIFDNY
ncbi:YiiX family permuted papain-like enzyme [Flavobacterium sp.]|uniref:YiiX family permuted papain-like enzyme n=1 Tax=Flavobacterium sp. TaxID=239 RepID=UPI002B4B3A01|nr:YiiX family permuted papain-like enzyme [Flavobacterium sp.]HLP64572.1 YiiX family permuted papain-like enzyme [Flavobacterium sp.]